MDEIIVTPPSRSTPFYQAEVERNGIRFYATGPTATSARRKLAAVIVQHALAHSSSQTERKSA